jgi:hypothetical protein
MSKNPGCLPIDQSPHRESEKSRIGEVNRSVQLERYGLLSRAGDTLSVPQVAEALRRLDERWDEYFDYRRPAA